MAETVEVIRKLDEYVDAKNFSAAFAYVKENQSALNQLIRGTLVREKLRQATDDKLVLSYLGAVGFERLPLGKALVALDKLLAFTIGADVLSEDWGLGKVVQLDSFYQRIKVDFASRKGHQFSYAAAVDMLTLPPKDHILLLRKNDPTAFMHLFLDKPTLVKRVLQSNGAMTVGRLEKYFIDNGFLKAGEWKRFWDEARALLRADKAVRVPTKRTDQIQLLQQVETFSPNWLSAFAQQRDAKLIQSGVAAFMAHTQENSAAPGELSAEAAALKAEERKVIGDRLQFALTAASRVNDVLYVQLAHQIRTLGYETPSAAEMRAYLWERKRYVKTASALPVREVGWMVAFLAEEGEDAKLKLCQAIPSMCYAAVQAIVEQFADSEACRRVIADLLKQPKAPATLTALLVGHYERFNENLSGAAKSEVKQEAGQEAEPGKKKSGPAMKIKIPIPWREGELPPLITLLTHAIALGEGRQSGETLKMQNIVRRLFADTKWLEKIFRWLSDSERILVFERFQASIAWDPSTHHTIVMRMVRTEAAQAINLEKYLARPEQKRDYANTTSRRGYALRKAEYLKVINVDMPENVRKIEFAKGFGDLSENAEYQYAKDEQRQLMQKQADMQAALERVKAVDFEDASVEEVMPGVTVVVDVNGEERTYTVLGEWDSDSELNIISSMAGLAKNMMGKKPGDQFDVPGGEGAAQFGRIVQIKPLSDEVRAWMQVPAGLSL